jgi:hypothetical protein
VTNRNAVRDILYRAGAEGASLTVTRAFSSPRQGLRVILRQLEDCVLPRRFELSFDGGARVVLEVAERQVQRLAAVEGAKGTHGADAGLSPGPLHPEDARALSDLLSEVCRGAGSVRIACHGAEEADPSGGGISLGALRETAGIPADPVARPGDTTWLDAIVDHQKVDIRSAVLIDVDEAHVVTGSTDEAEALADWAIEMLDVFLADGFPLAPELETKGAVTFAPQQNGSHILLAGLRGQFLLALVSGPDMAATLSAWQRVAEREVDGFLEAV